MEQILQLISDVGLPIAGALVMGFFIFIIIKQMMEGLIDNIKTLTIFSEGLENRARSMSNEIVKIDFFIPGCPPDAQHILKVLQKLVAGAEVAIEYPEFKYD